ncbi:MULTISPECIES: ATP-binding protein [Streptomyces violaceoruber group]|uniref:DNA binding domain-containing protein n=1 Tax=Streptomyces rubrogriseus TaxID=194673 RepID=A0ABT4P5H3_9ACTN|nr:MULTISPECIES: ATP-binding protein [Streptomyces anthocyanicus group]MCW8123114.1 putative DNA binding domain-containing protein [Streptomyces anthocyanicus]MCZ4636286.1 putative DNA binding domain-containing protein [Streptomyces rubrogriseus]
MFETVTISLEQAGQLLAKQEGHFLDFKDKRIAPAKIARAVSAFCNADGGDLYIGVRESASGFSWEGFDDPEDANQVVHTLEEVSPFGTDTDAEFLYVDGLPGYVLHINARKSRAIRKTADGKIYKRLSAQNSPVVTEDALTALRRQKGLDSFESETLPIDVDVVTNSEAIIEYLLSAIPVTEPETYLRKQHLLVSGKPVVAAALLFADEPQACLPKRCGIKVYRYSSEEQSRDRLVEDPVTIEGPLYKQIYDAVDRTVQIVAAAAFLDADGLRSVKYPHEALHEIITNSVLHRDYSVTDDIHIRIFENRIEIQSPGRLPGHITTKNILDERLSRNPYLVRHLNRFPNPPNKDVGEGLNTAFESMKKLNLRSPIIEEKDNSVMVTVRHESLASPAQQVVEHLKANGSIRNEQARKLTGVGSESRMKKIFENLIRGGEIEHKPGTAGRGYAYQLRKKPDSSN